MAVIFKGVVDWIFGAQPQGAPSPEPIEAPKTAEAQSPAPAAAPTPKPPKQATVQRPKGHAEAARRIAAFSKRGAKAKATQWLDLSGLGMTTLPPEINQAADAGQINLNSNELTDQAIEPVSRLLKLKQLMLRKNKISGNGLAALTSLPELNTLDVSHNTILDSSGKPIPFNTAALSRLVGLSTLYVNGNHIDPAGAQGLASLINLTALHAQNNQLGNGGVAALKPLVRLKTLELNNNAIGAEGVTALASLTTLQTLNLDRNKIGANGADPLAALPALKTLDLSRTGVTSLGFIEGLKKLKTIGLNGLQLTTADADLLNRKGLRVYLHKAKLGDFPAEALSRNGTDDCMPTLRQHIEARKDDETIEVRDVKIMLLGNGTVGKTQLRRRLEGLEYDDKVESTHGVEIRPVSLEPAPGAPEGTPPTPLQIWDFGGQDIYLGTHALFMKTRAVFPILWTPKSEDNETHVVDGIPFRNYPLNEWLRYVQQLAGEESPVLLIQSQCKSQSDIQTPKVDETRLEAFRNPPKLYYSAELRQPHDVLVDALRKAVNDLAVNDLSKGEHSGKRNHIPKRWNNVKAAVEQRSKKHKRMMRADFVKICNEKFVTDTEAQDVLLRMLHDFGTVFHDPEVLGDLIILDQNWALNAIYSVFERKKGTHAKLKALSGRFTRTDLGDLIWNASENKYTPEDQAAFVDMMIACKAAFVLRAASETHGEALYIAPDLLPERSSVEDQLERFEKEPPDAVREFEFAFALPSMLRDLMGGWATQVGQKGVYWQEGLLFKKSKSYAIVEAIRPGDRSWSATVRIRAWRGDAAAVVEKLSTEVRVVAERFGAEPTEGREDLLDSLSPIEDVDQPEIAPPEALEPDEPKPPPRCFISYAWGGDRADGPEDSVQAAKARELAFHRVNARLNALGYDTYFDKERLRHGESISQFIEEATSSPLFAIILSKKYLLDSQWCMDELLRIWRSCGSRSDAFRKRVRVILLDDAAIDRGEDRYAVSQRWNEIVAEETRTQDLYAAEKRAVPTDVRDRLRTAQDLVHNVPEILAYIMDAYPLRGVDQIEELKF